MSWPESGLAHQSPLIVHASSKLPYIYSTNFCLFCQWVSITFHPGKLKPQEAHRDYIFVPSYAWLPVPASNRYVQES